MNILYLPNNVASMPAITAEVMNKKKGISSKYITYIRSIYTSKNRQEIFLPRKAGKRTPFLWITSRLFYKRRILSWIKWADVVHYTWGAALEDGYDIKYARKLGKKIFVEWVGSDIRNPEILMTINTYYKDIWDNGYEYKMAESAENSLNNQKLFADSGAIPLYCPEMKIYIKDELFTDSKLIFQRINCNVITPSYPLTGTTRPLIVHAPSAKICKGSGHIIKAMHELSKEFDFEFVLLHDRSRNEVLEILSKADIFIDQIILGSYGMAAMEAMSYGKPVMCYIMPEVFENGLPLSCPIINTHQENIIEKIKPLLLDGTLRNKIGRESRQYVEKYHDTEKVTEQLLDLYKG